MSQRVYIVLDHEDQVLKVFATRESADTYIREEWRQIPGEPLWHVEEFEVRGG